MRSLPVLAAIVLTLAAASFAGAQVPSPPTPVYTVELLDAPTQFPEPTANASVTAPFRVVLTLSNVVCGGAVTIPVTLTATAAGAPAFFGVAVEPATIDMTISQGPHGSPPVGTPAQSTGDSVATATITGNITTNASVQVTIQADAPAPPSGPTGCTGAAAIGPATTTAVIFANMTAPPPPPAPEPEPEETPGLGVLAVAAVAVGVALVARRRQH